MRYSIGVVLLVACGGTSTKQQQTSSTGGDGGGGAETVYANGSYTDNGPVKGVSTSITKALVTCVDVASARSFSFGFALNPLVGTPTLTGYSGPPGSDKDEVVGSVKIDFNDDPTEKTYSFSDVADACVQFDHYYADSNQAEYVTFQANSNHWNCAGTDPSSTQAGSFSLQLNSVVIASGLCTAHGSLTSTLIVQDYPTAPLDQGNLMVTF